MSGSPQTLAVVGAGTMGRGLAQVGVAAGMSVRLADADRAQLEAARERIVSRLARDQIDAGPLLVIGTTDEMCAGADIVIEAVFEDPKVKARVIAEVEAAVSASTVIATNTSGIPVNTLASTLTDASRFVGMHFFNPVHRMALVEVIPGKSTSDATIAIAQTIAERLGKTPVVVADSPGFVASRLNCMLGNEALMMLESGIAEPEAIDTAAKLGLNHPMGPLELLDLVGLDVRLAAQRTLQQAYGDRFAPTKLHEDLVARGRLGVKAGAGIYKYDESGKRIMR